MTRNHIAPALAKTPGPGDAPALPPKVVALTPLPKEWNEGDELPHRDFDGRERGAPQPEPKVGMGVTHGYGADRYPGTIVAVSASGRSIWVVDDRHTYDGGPRQYGDPGKDEHHHFFRTDRGLEDARKANLCKDGRFHWEGDGVRGPSLSLGIRRYHRDPHF